MASYKVSWPIIKNFCDERYKALNWIDYGDHYLIICCDGDITVQHKMVKNGSVSDVTDFETNYKNISNVVVNQTDRDGATYTRPKTTDQGWRYEPRCLDFYTSKHLSLYNRKHHGGGILDGTDYGDASLKFYDSSDVQLVQGGAESDVDFQTRLTANCTKTIMEWQAAYDMDLIGGILQLKDTPMGDAYFWCIVAPDIPEELGGSIPFFASGLNLHFYQSGTIHYYDGRGAKRFLYDPVYNSNKFHFVLKHQLGEQVGMQIIIDQFKE